MLIPPGFASQREPLARAAGHRLRAPGRLASRDPPPRSSRSARRWRAAPRPSSSTCTRRGTASIVVCHDETVDRTTNHRGAIADLTLGELREMDNAYWWIEGDAVTPGPRRGRVPAPGQGARRPSLRRRDARGGVRGLPGRACSTSTSSAPRPMVEPYEQLLADELRRLGRTDSVIVASFHDARSSGSAPWPPRSRRPRRPARPPTFFFSLLDGAPPVVPPVSRLPGAGDLRRRHRRRRAFRGRGPRRGRGRARVDDQRDRARWPGCSTWGSTGSSATRRRRWSRPVGRERDCAWDGAL